MSSSPINGSTPTCSNMTISDAVAAWNKQLQGQNLPLIRGATDSGRIVAGCVLYQIAQDGNGNPASWLCTVTASDGEDGAENAIWPSAAAPPCSCTWPSVVSATAGNPGPGNATVIAMTKDPRFVGSTDTNQSESVPESRRSTQVIQQVAPAAPAFYPFGVIHGCIANPDAGPRIAPFVQCNRAMMGPAASNGSTPIIAFMRSVTVPSGDSDSASPASGTSNGAGTDGVRTSSADSSSNASTPVGIYIAATLGGLLAVALAIAGALLYRRLRLHEQQTRKATHLPVHMHNLHHGAVSASAAGPSSPLPLVPSSAVAHAVPFLRQHESDASSSMTQPLCLIASSSSSAGPGIRAP